MSRETWSSTQNHDPQNDADADAIARVCLERYAQLGAKGAKPVVRADGRHEWTILAGIVLRQRRKVASRSTEADTYTCISLATGVKALPYSSLSSHGDVLHDCHAEVLARRQARIWLLEWLMSEAQGLHIVDPIFIKGASELYELAPGASFHLYCSTLACGDVSSSHLIASRVTVEGNANFSRAKQVAQVEARELLRGRNVLEAQGHHLRTKPGRPDAPVSISMSCSDKIVQWTLLGFQGALLSRCFVPLYFSTYVIGGDALASEELLIGTRKDAAAQCEAVLAAKAGKQGCIPHVAIVDLPFRDSREQVQARLLRVRPDAVVSGPSDTLDLVPAAGAIAWRLGSKMHSILEGRKQGASGKRGPDGLLPVASRSPLCKLEWFRAFVDASLHLDMPKVPPVYDEAKHTQSLPYAQDKLRLRGYGALDRGRAETIDSAATRTFLVQHLQGGTIGSRTTSAEGAQERHELDAAHADASWMPLQGWLVAGRDFQSFDIDGKIPTQQ